MSSYHRQAIALAYGRNPVPVVTAKGEDDLAIQMLEEAQRQGVFVTEDPQLLALLSRLNVDQEIPPELYTAVAVILSWVYWLKGMQHMPRKVVNTVPQEVFDIGTATADDLVMFALEEYGATLDPVLPVKKLRTKVAELAAAAEGDGTELS